ncbi:hypothetical protein [Desulfovibrio litoralis]|uniref:Uncharacterized protein n=1 Tax=Desulfovibrio litoralis DSM 11393 TaxID=1121455 RepID=A0A1M7SXE7_9BACT|nr:hypothetical protein [Desulfovibrio litoralis]SHN63185.1 hypothetical protein SAMN02745728_01351 [Desulfovibrio litoralis DSM 11393]
MTQKDEKLDEKLEVTPYFDMELVMQLTQETRIDGELMDSLLEYWEKWLPHLNAHHLSSGKLSYLVVWLNKEVEDDVDNAWEESPSQAFSINALAQAMCTAAIHSLVPEVQEAGCAPAPKPTDALQDLLEKYEINYLDENGGLARRYSTVTFYPFKGGCEICWLQKDCPKANGEDKLNTVTLPGYQM